MINISDCNIEFTSSVYDNLKLIEDNYTKFIIKKDDVELPAVILKPYRGTYYAIWCDIVERNTELISFEIIFGDIYNFEINNNCHIGSLQKFGQYSGTQIMNVLIDFLKLIRVEKVTIYDDTKIIKDGKIIDLSLYKLLTCGQTFYQRFGFEPTYRTIYHKSIFGKQSDIILQLNNNINWIKNLDSRVLRQYYLKFLDINKSDDRKLFRNDYMYYLNAKDSRRICGLEECDKIVNIFSKIVDILDSDLKFVDLLVKLFLDEVDNYCFIEEYVLKYIDVVAIEDGKEKLVLEFIDYFFYICQIKKFMYVLEL
jgi:hypothetical protein